MIGSVDARRRLPASQNSAPRLARTVRERYSLAFELLMRIDAVYGRRPEATSVAAT